MQLQEQESVAQLLFRLKSRHMDFQVLQDEQFEGKAASQAGELRGGDEMDGRAEGSEEFGYILSEDSGLVAGLDDCKTLPVPFYSHIEQSPSLSENEFKDSKSRSDQMSPSTNPSKNSNQLPDISIYIEQLSQPPSPSQKLPTPTPSATPNALSAYRNSKKQQRLQEKKNKGNSSKNILKNFGRNIITYVEESKYLFSEEFKKMNKNYLEYFPKLIRIRETISTIKDMRGLWLSDEHGALMRRVSENYFRKKALAYIFNSNVKPEAFSSHICFRGKLREALKRPQNFTNLQ